MGDSFLDGHTCHNLLPLLINKTDDNENIYPIFSHSYIIVERLFPVICKKDFSARGGLGMSLEEIRDTRPPNISLIR